MKNYYKNKMRALCLSIVLASAVSAVEKTKPSVKTKKESQDSIPKQNQKKTLTKKEMAQQKSDDEFLNARIKKNQKNTKKDPQDFIQPQDFIPEYSILEYSIQPQDSIQPDSIMRKKFLVIGGKETQELDEDIAKDLLEVYNKRQLEADKKSGSVVIVFCESLKNVPKNMMFDAIFSSEQYLDYTSEMEARISQKKDEANINFNTADLSKAETISWIESSNACFKNAQPKALIEARNAFLKNAQEVLSEKNRQLVDLLKKGAYLTLYLMEVRWILEVFVHPDVTKNPPKINYYPLGQHCRVELINFSRKDLSQLLAQKANSDRITDIFKGIDLLPDVLADVLAAFNKVESNPKGHNMTVGDVNFAIVLPLLQMGEHDKVMKNFGMERCDDEPITYDEECGWSVTYKKVGEPVTSDSAP